MSSPKDVQDAPERRSETAEGEPLIAVVVPTYNEAENLPELVERLFALGIPNTRLIIVDDGSPDGTGDVVEALARRLDGRIELIQRGRKMGLGTAYVTGFSRAMSAGAEYVLQMDADLSHAPEYVPEMLEELKAADVVVGSRYVPGGGTGEGWSLMRRSLSSIGNLGIRAVSGVRVRDATAGFKAFRASVIGSMDLTRFRCKGFGFQAEMAFACERAGYKVVEHPIVFEERHRGYSKMSVLIVVEALWRLALLRWKRR